MQSKNIDPNRPYLIGIKNPYMEQRFYLEPETTTVGRASSCDIVLEHGTISGKHASITREGEEIHIEDLGSTNGTYINEQRIEKRKLRPEDLVRFDEYEFRFMNPVLIPRTIVNPKLAARPDATIAREIVEPSQSGTEELPIVKATSDLQDLQPEDSYDPDDPYALPDNYDPNNLAGENPRPAPVPPASKERRNPFEDMQVSEAEKETRLEEPAYVPNQQDPSDLAPPPPQLPFESMDSSTAELPVRPGEAVTAELPVHKPAPTPTGHATAFLPSFEDNSSSDWVSTPLTPKQPNMPLSRGPAPAGPTRQSATPQPGPYQQVPPRHSPQPSAQPSPQAQRPYSQNPPLPRTGPQPMAPPARPMAPTPSPLLQDSRVSQIQLKRAEFPGVGHYESTRGKPLLLSLLAGFILTSLLGSASAFLGTWWDLGFEKNPLAIVVHVLSIYPYLHTHFFWMESGLPPGSLIALIGAPLSVVIGALTARNLSRSSSLALPLLFTFLYALTFLAIQYALAGFNIPELIQSIAYLGLDTGSNSTSLIIVDIYFFAASLVLSLLGVSLSRH